MSQFIWNDQLQGQKHHFFKALLMVSSDKHKNKDAHMTRQIESPVNRERLQMKCHPVRQGTYLWSDSNLVIFTTYLLSYSLNKI